MTLGHGLTWVELIGYAASLLVFSTFYMKTMIPLRCVAVASNVVFIAYASFSHLFPVLFLHILLLPLNFLRLRQMYRLIRRVRQASQGNYSLEWLVPFMSPEPFNAGDRIFEKGDPADKLYYIEAGAIHLPEVGVTVGPGEIIGEIGIFSPYGERTASAVCEADTVCRVLANDKVLELYFQNPEFGLYLVRTILGRLLTRKE